MRRLTRLERQRIAALLVVLAPISTTIALMLSGQLGWAGAAAKLIVDVPVTALGVFMNPPRVDPNTGDLMVMTGRSKP